MDPQLLILGRLTLAMLLGAVIGAERELADKPAGLRTHAFVAGTAALVVGLGMLMETRTIELASGLHPATDGRADSLRVISAVITGVSFLGAGTILYRKEHNHLEGLTTAASILLTAGVGMATGMGQYKLAAGTVALTLLVLVGMWPIDRMLGRHHLRRGSGGVAAKALKTDDRTSP